MSTGRILFVSALVLAMSLLPGQNMACKASISNTQRTSSERSQKMKINIKININSSGKILTATLADNATARDFASVLPLNVSMNDLFGREKYGDLPKALSENGPRKSKYEVGDIAYWSPDHQFAVYYHQDGEARRYLRPASSRSQRLTPVQKRSTCVAR
jgi:hypothetical protein